MYTQLWRFHINSVILPSINSVILIVYYSIV